MPRGSRPQKRGRLNWRNKKASHGRRGAQGKRKGFTSWKEVRKDIRRNRTVIVVPSEEEREKKRASLEAKSAETEAPATVE